MTQNEFSEWLSQLEDESQKDSHILNDSDRKEILDKVMRAIHDPEAEKIFESEPEPNIDNILESFNPETYNVSKINSSKDRRRLTGKAKKFKAASIIIICSVILGLASFTYAAAYGELFGVFKTTPELESQLDVPNPILPLYDPDQILVVDQPVDCTNSTILTPSSFEMPEIYKTATDVYLIQSNSSYLADSFIFNKKDIAVFTQDDGSGWNMNQGEGIALTLAIDTSFAACEPVGEYIEFGYIYNGKYCLYDLHKVNDDEHTFSFTAPEDGEYYLAITNRSLSYIKITSLRIKE